MTEPGRKRSTTPAAILMAVAAAIMLIGVGRCGFLQPMIHPVMDDYGLGGMFCMVLGFALLIGGLAWFIKRRRL